MKQTRARRRSASVAFLLAVGAGATLALGRAWRPALPGTREPGFGPLTPAAGAWLDGVARLIDPSELRATVEQLPGPRDRFEARDAMAAAEDAILRALREAGWAAERRAFVFEDVRPGGVSSYDRVGRHDRLAGANVVAIREGTESRDAVIVVAHYDTVQGTPGADDNTASVAALLALARALAPCRFRRTVVLAATDMEEIGFFGAYALVDELRRERRILAAIDFETMAYTSSEPGGQTLPPGSGLVYPRQARRMAARQHRGDFTACIYNGAATGLVARFGEGLAHLAGRDAVLLLRDPKDLPVVGALLARALPAVRHFSRGDHVPFWEAGIPAVWVTDTADARSPHYHAATDTADTLDYVRLAAIAGATAHAVAATAGLVPEAPAPGDRD